MRGNGPAYPTLPDQGRVAQMLLQIPDVECREILVICKILANSETHRFAAVPSWTSALSSNLRLTFCR